MRYHHRVRRAFWLALLGGCAYDVDRFVATGGPDTGADSSADADADAEEASDAPSETSPTDAKTCATKTTAECWKCCQDSVPGKALAIFRDRVAGCLCSGPCSAACSKELCRSGRIVETSTCGGCATSGMSTACKGAVSEASIDEPLVGALVTCLESCP